MTKICSTLLLAGLAGLGGCTGHSETDVDETAQAASASSTASRWPSFPINYWIDVPGKRAGDPSQPHCSDSVGTITDATTIQSIHDAVAAYEAQTPIRFVELTTKPTGNPGFPVLIFTAGGQSNPHAGGVPATATASNWQACVFLPPGSLEAHTIQHETGHQVGLQHEQRRSDYCGTITIDSQCMTADAHDGSGDEPFKTNTSSQLLTPYDIHSIMQYRNSGFCDDSCKIDGVCQHPPLMLNGCTGSDTSGACALGGATDFSPDDINALYRMYEPSLGTDETNDQLGAAMAAGDFDGDGYTDLAVGAPGEAPGSEPTTGVVMLYKGTEGGLVAWKLLRESDFVSLGASTHAGDRFGAAIAAGRYFSHSNSRVEDLIIGAPGYRVGGVASAGAVFLYKGQGIDGSRQPIATTMYTDAAPGGADQFGSTVAIGYLGTANAIAVGAPNAAKFSIRNGMAFMRHAGDSAWTTYSLDSGGLFAPAAGTSFGGTVAIGAGDLAVAAPGAFKGAVYLYSGTNAYLGSVTAPNPVNGDQFGKALVFGTFSFAQSRLAVGAPNAGTGGLVALVTTSGTIQRTNVFTQADIPGMSPEAGDRFGASLAAGDIDADLIEDLAIGVPGENSNQGVVAFVHGQSLTGWTWRGEKDDGFPIAAGDQYGTSVAIGGFGDLWDDVNDVNDPAADIAVGAPFRHPNGVTNAGTFQEFLGGVGLGPTFQLGFDEQRVNGIQPRRAGAPAPLSCPVFN